MVSCILRLVVYKYRAWLYNLLGNYCLKFKRKSSNPLHELFGQFILGIFVLTSFRLIGGYKQLGEQ